MVKEKEVMEKITQVEDNEEYLIQTLRIINLCYY